MPCGFREIRSQELAVKRSEDEIPGSHDRDRKYATPEISCALACVTLESGDKPHTTPKFGGLQGSLTAQNM